MEPPLLSLTNARAARVKGLDGPLRVAVGGGKGGVGKSVVAANLACAMAELGFRTILVDADLGSANQHTLFGIDRPGVTLQALIDRKIETLEEAVTPTPYGRLFLVPGSGAVVGAANVAHGQKLKLIRHIARLDADAIIIDCGAGTSYNVVDLFAGRGHQTRRGDPSARIAAKCLRVCEECGLPIHDGAGN